MLLTQTMVRDTIMVRRDIASAEALAPLSGNQSQNKSNIENQGQAPEIRVKFGFRCFFVLLYRNGGREGNGENNHERTGNGFADGYLTAEGL